MSSRALHVVILSAAKDLLISSDDSVQGRLREGSIFFRRPTSGPRNEAAGEFGCLLVLPLAASAASAVRLGISSSLERELTLELIRAMAEKKPERVVCLDEVFAGNDQLKANAVQIFKTKGVTSFKTV
jgi:hypothetical protein